MRSDAGRRNLERINYLEREDILRMAPGHKYLLGNH